MPDALSSGRNAEAASVRLDFRARGRGAMDRKQGKKGTTGKLIGLGVLLLVALTLQNCGVI